MTLSPTSSRIVRRAVLPNGLVAIAIENATADIVSARIFIKAGSLLDPLPKSGLTHLLAATITKGTDELSSLEIAERVESVGASLGADTGTDYFLLSFKTVSSDFSGIFELAGQLLRSPAFPESEIELESHLALQALRSQKEQPYAVAFSSLRSAMYPDHPYGISSLGREETLPGLERADLFRYHQTYFRPDNIVVSIAGCIPPDKAIAEVERVFGDWRSPAIPLAPVTFARPVPQKTTTVVSQETQQAIVMLGYLAPAALRDDVRDGTHDTNCHGNAHRNGRVHFNEHPDYAALKLLNTYLGNGLSSRLFVELREKRGLAYDVSAFYPTRVEPSHFVTYMGTAPSNTDAGVAGLQQELDRLREHRLTDEELQAAKNKLLGQYALGKQTNAQLAQIYGWYEAIGLGIDFDARFQDALAAVTSDGAREVARTYFQESYLSLVGPAAAVRADER